MPVAKEISLNDLVRVSEGVVFQEVDGEGVLLNLETGIYFGLNRIGTSIWNLIEKHGSLQRVFEAMAQEYEVLPDSLEKDLLRLVGQLCQEGLVHTAPLRGITSGAAETP